MNLVSEWLKYTGMKKAEFARRGGITTSSVTNLTRPGSHTRRETAEKYAHIFNLTPEEFLAGPKKLKVDVEKTEEECRMTDEIIDMVFELSGEALKKLYLYTKHVERMENLEKKFNEKI
jgi:transcriptional regulator with XRE-family HTH domain